MRFTVVRMRNSDPTIPAMVIDLPLMFDEMDVWSMEDDVAHLEGWCVLWFDPGAMP